MHDRVTHRLLAVAHGTASAAGLATTRRVVDAVRAARPDVPVELCFLDVASPRLADVLAAEAPAGPPTVVVPVLLSTGYHVLTDIPDALAGRPRTLLARHLGPHPLLIDALLDRLPAGDAATVLVGAGSSRDEARAELDETAALLAGRLDAPVDVLTMADDLGGELRRRRERGGPVRVATYLLAEGRFTETLDRAGADGVAAVAPPIGVHPGLVELVWSRYDEALAGRPLDFPGTAR